MFYIIRVYPCKHQTMELQREQISGAIGWVQIGGEGLSLAIKERLREFGGSVRTALSPDCFDG